MSDSGDKTLIREVQLLASDQAGALSVPEAERLLEELAAVLFQTAPKSEAASSDTAGSDFLKPTPGSRSDNFDVIYGVLAQQIPAVVFLAFLDEGIGQAYVSPHIETVLGFSQQEWLNDPVRWFKQLHPDDKQRWSIESAQMFLSGEPLQSVYRVLARDGRLVWFQCDARMLRHDNGQPWLVHGVAFDITELKQSQEALQKARDELEMRVQQRTSELARTVAVLEVEIAERKRAQEEVQKLNRTLETRVLERTQELHEVNAELARDIAERRRLEQQLLQAQKMESIGTLAGGIAHDFNNILNIIQGYTSVLGEPAANKEEIADSVKVINDSVERGTALVQQLLTLARKTEPKLQSIDVNGVIYELAKLLKETFPRSIEVNLDLDRDLVPTMADSNQITQALLNLCVNARDAMPNGGRLTIETELIDGKKLTDCEEAKADRYVCLKVADTGTGIDETVQSRIFEPFFTTKEIGRGTGLGLAVVYGIVRNHNGFIQIASRPGAGATFRLYLPLQSSAETLPASQSTNTSAPNIKRSDGRASVLLVEDEETMLRLLQETLVRQGHQVFLAPDGELAIQLYQHHKQSIDVVLLDVSLPKISGWEVFLKMKEEQTGVKVVVASGHLDPELKTEMYHLGVKDFVQKPYRLDEVIQTLQRVATDNP